ncbi:tetratricopeptide repeat protein [Xanthomarina spongicola]|uniref:Tetratricopeptide repeat protein n=1 Tax=Xanthomarina spongicola TaxID=570520 RepID=A0A316DT23_9FLAO|nr:tetratricopeptide repeat protein [Xanthomarina spongicola]PWK20618.1 tetratricopeptide repeat protein [Xanthomarina spongicola]
MKQKIYIFIFFFGMIFTPQINYAQIDFNKTPDDDLGDVEDRTQELFFEALKQKAIENYDRAVTALLQCIEIDKSQSVFYYELGKNYNLLKNFGEAEDALKKAVKEQPDNEWYLDELYEVYAQQNDYDKAIKTVKQLVKYHPDYKEDLANLYYRTKKYNDALEILDELDKEQGITLSRDMLRNQIYAATGRKKDQIENLEERVEDNPDEESNYLALIYRYSENNENEKAFETAKKLLEIKPNSQLVHLALYKFYLEENNPEQAIESMKIVLQSPQIKAEAKMMVLSDFVKFVGDNPQYEEDLVEATSFTLDDTNEKSLVELAQYYLTKGDKAKALEYYNEALKLDGDNFNILRNVLLLQIDLQNYEAAASKSEEALLKFPSQPLLYLVNGVALNKLNRANQAIETLEIGLDYIIDDPKMEADFYKQLSLAYTTLNNTVKAKTFSDKAKQLESTN